MEGMVLGRMQWHLEFSKELGFTQTFFWPYLATRQSTPDTYRDVMERKYLYDTRVVVNIGV